MEAPNIITVDLIRATLKNAELKPSQRRISLPMVLDYFKLLEHGSAAPHIKVSDNELIIEGHHRYIAGILFGKLPDHVPGTRAFSAIIYEWAEIDIDLNDWRKRKIK